MVRLANLFFQIYDHHSYDRQFKQEMNKENQRLGFGGAISVPRFGQLWMLAVSPAKAVFAEDRWQEIQWSYHIHRVAWSQWPQSYTVDSLEEISNGLSDSSAVKQISSKRL